MKNIYLLTIQNMKESFFAFYRSKKIIVIMKIFNILLIATGIILVIFGLLYPITEIIGDAIFIIFLGVLILVLFPLLNILIIRMTYKRLVQLSSGHELRVINEFTPDEMIVIDEASNGTRRLPYSQIVKIVESKNLFIIILKNSLLIPVSKDGFVDCSLDDFLSFISTKGKITFKK